LKEVIASPNFSAVVSDPDHKFNEFASSMLMVAQIGTTLRSQDEELHEIPASGKCPLFAQALHDVMLLS
jgi:hypothetical protein